MSMNGKAGNLGDVPKHLFLLELFYLKLKDSHTPICFFDAFGGNFISNTCATEAKKFYNFLEKNTKNDKQEVQESLKESMYYRLMKKMWKYSYGEHYYGSSKWILELISIINSGTNYRVKYNSYELCDVIYSLSCLSSPENYKFRVNITFQIANAYDLTKDYLEAIDSFERGVIFFDPYWGKNKDNDMKGCKKIITELSEKLNSKPNWSFLIWLPIYNKKDIEVSNEIEKHIKLDIKSYSIYKIESEKIVNNPTMQGVHLFLINDYDKLSERLNEVGFNSLNIALGRKNYIVKSNKSRLN